jgi:hypothetical protein
MLMCRAHWDLLSAAARAVIWREYRPGQERTKKPTVGYSIAQACAVALVAVTEGRFTRAQGLKHVEGRLLLLASSGRISEADTMKAVLRICWEMGIGPADGPMAEPKKAG